MRLPFFVYGTLRPSGANHGRFLHGRTLAEEPARLTGAVLYDGPGYPYAVEDPSGVVRGELVTARPEAYDELLRALDLLEDYVPGDPRNLYERVARDVLRDAGAGAGAEAGAGAGAGVAPAPVRAWVYVAAPAVAARLRARGSRIESGEWRPHAPER
ncbi:gamma-glutamylcyclotransferase family protein [Streptomyces poriticola]|uniref:gamma-glutamylcyclotransferase family protein n=1 Tax=Streptomyces poriticola TaxID=3120506 RepID=UPI002FCDECF6